MQVKRTWIIWICSFCVLLCFLYLALPRDLFSAPTSYVLEDASGKLLSAGIAADGQWRFPEPDHIPEKFKTCLIHFEDKRFYWHPGIDPVAMLRAVQQNFRGNRVVSGGSTLSMQVIRMSRAKPRSLYQKMIESVLALSLELHFSKAKILNLYAANAPFGGNVVGLEAASWRYFGRPPETLSWAESATLAVLPNAPSLIHPGKNRVKLREKRNRLLDRLAERGAITLETAKLAKLEEIPPAPLPLPQRAPHLLEKFRKESQKLDRRAQPQPNTKIRSTIDGPLQDFVTGIVSRHHAKNAANGILNASALVLDVDNGNVLAYVGNTGKSADPEQEFYVDMIGARRSPGSTLKPLLYAAMLQDGLILPKTLIPDIPTQIGGYTPQNFDLGFDGAVPADKSLARSLNIPAVKMLQQYRYQRFHELLKSLGFSTLDRNADHYGLSMILGGNEVTQWELTAIYASLARVLKNYEKNSGRFDPADFRGANFRDASTEPEREHAGKDLEASSFFDYAALYFTFQAMVEVVRPEEEQLWEQFSSSRKISWKTGTSFGFRDGWAIGISPTHVVCVWVGNADGEGRPGLTGIQTAAPILFEIFNHLPASEASFPVPLDFMIQTDVCQESGHLAGPDCPHVDRIYIPATGYKSTVCPYHHVIHTDPSGQYRVSHTCDPQSSVVSEKWFTLPPSMAYYYKQKNVTYKELPPYLPGCQPNSQATMEMIYPRNNAKIYLPLGQDGQKQMVIFTVAHQHSQAKVYWHLNNSYIGETVGVHQQSFKIDPGMHRLTLIDESGQQLECRFEILDKT